MIRARSILALAAALALLAGCGGGDDSTTSATSTGSSGGDAVEELGRYLPGDAKLISVVDLTGVRDQLGLDADADVLDIEAITNGDAGLDDPEGEAVTAAGVGIPPLSSFFSTLKADPVIAALDGTQVTAAASNQVDPVGQVVAVQTTQPYSEVADALVKKGYEQDGDTLSDAGAPISEVADAGDGVIVMSGDGAYSATDIAQSPPGGPQALVSLLEPPGDPIAVANSLTDADSCMTAFGGREQPDASSGTLRMRFDTEPDPANFDPEPLKKSGITTGEPTVDGDLLEVPFEAEPQPGGNPIGQMIATLKPLEIYDCG